MKWGVIAQILVAHAPTLPSHSGSLPVALILVLLNYILYYYRKKKTRGKAGHAEIILPVMTSIPVTSGHVTNVTSGCARDHFR
jgi:type II secretory pathway component PulF